MASHMDAAEEPVERSEADAEDLDRIDVHLLSALDAGGDDRARYHLREALQLQLAEMHDVA